MGGREKEKLAWIGAHGKDTWKRGAEEEQATASHLHACKMAGKLAFNCLPQPPPPEPA